MRESAHQQIASVQAGNPRAKTAYAKNWLRFFELIAMRHQGFPTPHNLPRLDFPPHPAQNSDWRRKGEYRMNPTALRTTALGFRPDRPRDTLASGLPTLDALVTGFPRGAISEIVGPESSGRTTLVHSLLAASTANSEICAYVDTDDSFDPVSAAAAGVALSQLVWI